MATDQPCSRDLEPSVAHEVETWCGRLSQIDTEALPEASLSQLVGALHKLGRLATGKAALVAAEAAARGTVKRSGARGAGDWMTRAGSKAGVTVTPGEAMSAGGLAERLAAERRNASHDPGGPMEQLVVMLSAGELSIGSAGQVVREADRTRVQAPAAADDGMRHLLEKAKAGATRSQLMDESKKFIAEHRTRGSEQVEAARRYHARALTRWQRQDDGTHLATLVTDDVGRAVLDAALRPHGVPRPDPQNGEPDRRSPDQRRHDALISLVRAVQAAGGSGEASGVTTTDGAATAGPATAGPATDGATTAGPATAGADCVATASTEAATGTVAVTAGSSGRNLPATARVSILISLEDLLTNRHGTLLDERRWLGMNDLRRLACEAEFVPILLDADGTALNVGRIHRRATERQRRALDARDRGCTYPGCTAPPCWCEAHHVRHWIDGGTTDMDNLALLCGHHHTVVHLHGYRARVGAQVEWDIRPGQPATETAAGDEAARSAGAVPEFRERSSAGPPPPGSQYLPAGHSLPDVRRLPGHRLPDLCRLPAGLAPPDSPRPPNLGPRLPF